MNYIISGGGTGGHIYPALEIGRELQRQDSNANVLYVGKKDSLEEELAKREGFQFKPVRVKGFPRKSLNKSTFESGIALIQGILDSLKIIRDFKPSAVIGTGGYVCAPIVLAAQFKKIPTVLQEQNAYPGKANRLLSKRAKIIATSFEEAKKYFPEDRILKTGNPIRRDFKEITTEEAKGRINLDIEVPFVLSFGGSGGQISTNNALVELLNENLLDFPLLHITGNAHYDSFLEKLNAPLPKNLAIIPYSHEIPSLMKLSSLVITSSSAMAIAEISQIGRASILIPKAYTAGNHQYHNAMSYKNSGASIVITEDELNGHRLYDEIHTVIDNSSLRESMEKSTRELAIEDSAEKIVNEIIKLVKNER